MENKSVNIEAFLLMAKYDKDIAQLIYSHREKAMDLSGIEFSKSERFLLSALSDNQLKKNIDNLNLKGVSRKSLPSWKKATAVIMLLASILTTTIVSCPGPVSDGITPDPNITPAPTPTEEPGSTSTYVEEEILYRNSDDS